MNPADQKNQQPGGPVQTPPPTPIQPLVNQTAQTQPPTPVQQQPNSTSQPMSQMPQTQVPQENLNATAPAANIQTPAPQTAPVMPPPPKRGFPIKILVIIVIVFLLIFAGLAAFSLITSDSDEPAPSGNQVFAPSATPQAGPREHVAEDYPDFSGIEITDKTVAFNKVDESFRIRYLGKIYHEQDTGKFQPREVFPETADDFKWYGLVETPEEVVGDAKLFSFKAPATYRSFVFIMRWDDARGEKYEMFRFHDNQVTKLEEYRKDRQFYVPVIDNFSLGGNFMSINIFSCPTCFDEEPEILLYHIPSGESRNIGRVSYFAWGDDDNAYEYKEYREGVDPNTVPLRKNEFFVESTNILNPF